MSPLQWSLNRYNVIVYGNLEDTIQSGGRDFPLERLFEYTDDEIKAIYKNDLNSLSDLPTLILSEIYGEEWRPASFGRVSEIETSGKRIRFHFESLYDGISSAEIFMNRHFNFSISRGRIDESSRTHWAIKKGNLIDALFKIISEHSTASSPKLFNVERWPLPSLGHVAVMMPFSQEFDRVYDAIQSICKSQNLKAIRVDDIYRPTRINDDIFSVIAQSRLVISDLTGRNPNVLYETGLAHALNRDVVMLVQNEQDVPFDLGNIRYVKYLPNSEGVEDLKKNLSRYIQGYQ